MDSIIIVEFYKSSLAGVDFVAAVVLVVFGAEVEVVEEAEVEPDDAGGVSIAWTSILTTLTSLTGLSPYPKCVYMISDASLLSRKSAHTSLECTDLLYKKFTLLVKDLTKDQMFAIEVGCLTSGDEKLRTIGVRTCIRH